MPWVKPEVEEIKMDAEIGSYQQEDEPVLPVKPGEPVVESAPS